MEHGTIATVRIWTGKIHGIRTARRGTLAQVSVILQRKEHEVVVEIVLPQECFGLLWIGSKAHVARQTVAIDFHVTAIGTLKRDAALSAVCHLEPRQTAIVAGMGIMKQAMLQRNGRTVGSLIDDADSLAVWDILATVGLGLNDGEVVELGIATLQTFMVKSKESMARTLEGDELIREWHHAT